jgi:UPF0042 nucleotide-binding protein
MNEKINLTVITGLSGAGKTKAIGILEDLGYFCVDNLPPGLTKNFLELVLKTEGKINKLGIVVDVRSGAFLENLPDVIKKLKEDRRFSVKVIFLEASVEALIKRFSETRRKHPVEDGATIQEKIEAEKKLLQSVRKNADFIIDTTNFSLKDLKSKIISIVSPAEPGIIEILITTFGFKYGMPLQADIVMDVRFIPNPFYIAELSNKDGRTKEIKEYVLSFSETNEFLKKFKSLLEFLIPNYIKEGKSYLSIAFGCTGGKHRSVALGEIIAEYLSSKKYKVKIYHRDIEK